MVVISYDLSQHRNVLISCLVRRQQYCNSAVDVSIGRRVSNLDDVVTVVISVNVTSMHVHIVVDTSHHRGDVIVSGVPHCQAAAAAAAAAAGGGDGCCVDVM